MKRLMTIAILGCVIAAFAGASALAQEAVTITIRCKANPPTEDWRCNNFAAVEEEVEATLGIDLELNLIQDNMDWGDYKNEFVLASEAGEAPDIVLTGHEDIGSWGAAGIIIPLDDLVAEHAQFEDMVPSLWESMKFEGQIYGVPQDAEARPFYYSKLLLADLGWSEEEIAALPETIAAGEFTFEDAIATAQQAVEEGVIEEGNGFWHRPSNGPDFLYYYYGMGGEVLDEEGNLVFDQDAALAVFDQFGAMREAGVMGDGHLGIEWSEWHTTVSSGEDILFWNGGTWNWMDWAVNYMADQGGNDYLVENLGAALVPAMETGVPITLTHPLAYLISADSERPDVAMALLAAITTPEANNRHAIDSSHLGILVTQIESEEYADTLLGEWHYMLDYTTFLPNHPGWNSWSEAYWLGIRAVESGELSPEDALQTTVDQMVNELGENITIR